MGERYDIVIIGAGPAGMEAAITAKIANFSNIFPDIFSSCAVTIFKRFSP